MAFHVTVRCLNGFREVYENQPWNSAWSYTSSQDSFFSAEFSWRSVKRPDIFGSWRQTGTFQAQARRWSRKRFVPTWVRVNSERWKVGVVQKLQGWSFKPIAGSAHSLVTAVDLEKKLVEQKPLSASKAKFGESRHAYGRECWSPHTLNRYIYMYIYTKVYRYTRYIVFIRHNYLTGVKSVHSPLCDQRPRAIPGSWIPITRRRRYIVALYVDAENGGIRRMGPSFFFFFF